MTDLLHLLAWAWRAVPAGPDLLLIALGLLLLAVVYLVSLAAAGWLAWGAK